MTKKLKPKSPEQQQRETAAMHAYYDRRAMLFQQMVEDGEKLQQFEETTLENILDEDQIGPDAFAEFHAEDRDPKLSHNAMGTKIDAWIKVYLDNLDQIYKDASEGDGQLLAALPTLLMQALTQATTSLQATQVIMGAYTLLRDLLLEDKPTNVQRAAGVILFTLQREDVMKRLEDIYKDTEREKDDASKSKTLHGILGLFQTLRSLQEVVVRGKDHMTKSGQLRAEGEKLIKQDKFAAKRAAATTTTTSPASTHRDKRVKSIVNEDAVSAPPPLTFNTSGSDSSDRGSPSTDPGDITAQMQRDEAMARELQFGSKRERKPVVRYTIDPNIADSQQPGQFTSGGGGGSSSTTNPYRPRRRT